MEKNTKPIWYKRRRNWVIAAVIVLIFFVSRGITTRNTPARETAIVTKGTVKQELVLSGELKAIENAVLQFNQSGTLSFVSAKVGDRVKKGQVLMKLDTTSTNAAYQQALSNLLAQSTNVDKVHDDLKGKDSTETFAEKNTRVAAEVAKDNAYNAMLVAQKTLREGSLIAPFSGIISQLTNEAPGVNIALGSPQISVVNPETLYLLVNADQTDVSNIKAGDKAQVVLDSFLEEKLEGVVTKISFTPSLSEAGTVYPVHLILSINNKDYKYKVGMTGDSSFTLSQKENVLSVPTRFIKSDKDGKFVYTDSQNTKKYITVGIEGDDKVEVQGDISEGVVVYD